MWEDDIFGGQMYGDGIQGTLIAIDTAAPDHFFFLNLI